MMTAGTAGTITVTRRDLYEQVWNSPMRTLAPTYGLSDVGLAKVCQRYEIPRPPVGYWAKKEFGKPVDQPPLPEIGDPKMATITFHALGEEERAEPAERPLPADPDLVELVKAESGRDRAITVPETLHSAHPAVTRTRDAILESIRDKRFDRHGMASPSFQLRNQCFGMSIGKDSLPRVMRLLNALCRALEARGFPLKVTPKDERSCPRFVGYGSEIVVSVSEKSTRMEHVLTAEEKARIQKYPHLDWSPKWDYHPSGQLTLGLQESSQYGEGTTWKDTKRAPLERQLTAIVAEIPYLIDESRRRTKAANERARREFEEQRRRYDEEKRRREEEGRVKAILDEAGAWQRARLLRDYADTLRSEAIDRYGRLDEGSEMDKWLAWINRVAEQLDPVEKRCPKPAPQVPPGEAPQVPVQAETSGSNERLVVD